MIGFVGFEESPSMATAESGGDQHHLTEYCRHFVKMNVVGARRQYSGRYKKWPCRS